jgi:DNA polymerase-3 subunit alpha
MNGIIAKAIENGNDALADHYMKWFIDVFADDFYIEVQPHNPKELNEKLISLADKFNVKPTVTLDCHYASPEDRIAEEIMLILGTHPKINKDSSFDTSRKISDVMERLDYLYGDRQMSFKELDIYLMSYEETLAKMCDQGIDRLDIFESTTEISEKIENINIPRNKDLLPVDHKDPNHQLEDMAVKGLKEMGLFENEEYRTRLFEELDIIKSKNFSSYFLVVGDMIQWAKSNGIMVGPGRGSSAGSLVCYALGITSIDPIKYNLLFFRFIDPSRDDFPDVDTDIMDSRRGEVKDYLTSQYTNVASIATYLTFKDKGVVRDVARAFHVPLPEVNKSLKGVEKWEEFISSPNTEEFRKKYPEVVKYAEDLRGRIRGTGLHAAGIVAAKEKISKFAPIETRKDPHSDERIPVVAVDMDEAADIGLIKIDALGLKTLTVISDTLDEIERRTNKRIDLNSITLDDREVFADLGAGLTKGVFQCEAVPYTNLLIKMGVTDFNDLVASNALVRPGAMNTIGADYIKRKKGRQVVSYLHPILKDFTQDTYGCILYQEQVMQTCVHLGGMTMEEANKVRKIIGKKKDAKEFDQFREKFVSGATNHISKEAAEHLWHDFEAHAGYSFNKSHAVAYSTVSYWTAWLKRYYPLEFMFAVLKNEKDKDARTEYLIEAKRMGIKILLPHINESELDFSIDGDSIRFGLSNIKFISENIGKKILEKTPYKNYVEFLEMTKQKGSGINSRAVDALNKVGAAAFKDNPRTGNENYYEFLNIPEFNNNIPRWLDAYIKPVEEYEEKGAFVILAMVKSIKRGEGWSRVEVVDKTGAVGIFDDEQTVIEPGKMYLILVGDNRIVEYIDPDKLKETKTSFSKYLLAKTMPIVENEYYVVAFSPRKTKKGDKMATVILSEQDKQLLSVVVFPKLYSSALVKLKPGAATAPVLSELSDGGLTLRSFN